MLSQWSDVVSEEFDYFEYGGVAMIGAFLADRGVSIHDLSKMVMDNKGILL